MGGVDMVDTGPDGLTEHGEGLSSIGGRSEHTPARQLHGAEAHSMDRAAGEHNGVGRHAPIMVAVTTGPVRRTHLQ
jgi:hypothetical protein